MQLVKAETEGDANTKAQDDDLPWWWNPRSAQAGQNDAKPREEGTGHGHGEEALDAVRDRDGDAEEEDMPWWWKPRSTSLDKSPSRAARNTELQAPCLVTRVVASETRRSMGM